MDSEWNSYNPGYCTASEALGYGMMISALMAGYPGDNGKCKENFDAFWALAKKYPSIIPSFSGTNYNTAWRIPEDPSIPQSTTPGNADDSATDGDIDMIYALLLAYAQWGQVSYLNDATNKMNSLMYECVTKNSIDNKWILTLGDWVYDKPSHSRFKLASRPSDWIFDALETFSRINLGASSAQQLNSKVFWDLSLAARELIINSGNYLLPDFTWKDFHNNGPWTEPVPSGPVFTETGKYEDYWNSDPSATNPDPEPYFLEGWDGDANDGNFDDNACRVPWRIASHFYHYAYDINPFPSGGYLVEFNNWRYDDIGVTPASFKDGYYLDGTSYGSPGVGHFVSPSIAAAVCHDLDGEGHNQEYLDNGWNWMKNQHQTYFDDSITMLCMILVSGNWWNPAYKIGSIEPEIPQYPEWKIGDTYQIGDIVSYNNVLYECIQAHTAYASNWTPPNTPALWKLYNN